MVFKKHLLSVIAVAIMAGLTFATILTLLFVPVLYAIFHNVKVPKQL